MKEPKIGGDQEISITEDKVEVPETEGSIFSEKGTFLGVDDFKPEAIVDGMPETFLRPIVVTGSVKEMPQEDGDSVLDVKSTAIMTKASFVEFPISIDGVDYNFVQWKGSCPKKSLEQLDNQVGQRVNSHIEFPLGNDGVAPIFIIDINEEQFLVRFMGTSYYDDLIEERKKSEMMEKTGLRMPRIMGTFKFSREFCKRNNLPMPETDDPGDLRGESLKDYLEARKKEMDPVIYSKIRDQYASGDFDSPAILGENVRIFRNIFRVMDIEEVLKESDELRKIEKLSVIIKTSRAVFQKELGREIDNEELLVIFSDLLGKQFSILLKNKIIQGAMSHHKQDITLAAEICDFDTAYQLTEEYFVGKPDYARENEKKN